MLFPLDKNGWRRLWEDLVAAFQYLKGVYRKAGEELSTRACRERARSNGL